MTKDGTLISEKGTIGGWSITDYKIYGGDSDTGVAVMQRPSDETVYVFAAGGTSHESYADCPFRVNKAGDTWANTLTVAGSATIGGNVLVPNSGIALANGYGVHHYLSSGSYSKFEYVNASNQFLVGNSSYATYLYGSSITSSKSITTSSDRRLKQNICPLDGLGLVDTLAPVSYRLKDDPDLVHYGFVAQDVEAALDALDIHGSALVQTNAATGMKSIAYVEIIPLLVTEIQALKQQVRNLQRRLCA